jgi:hypothetical protein
MTVASRRLGHAGLVTGSGKDLLEAVARRVLVQGTGLLSAAWQLPATLYQAFDRSGLATPPQQSMAAFARPLIQTRASALNK